MQQKNRWQKKNRLQKKNTARLFYALLSFFCLCSAGLLSAQESADARVVLRRESWNGFLADWTALKQEFGTLEAQRQTLQERSDLLLPRLGHLETMLNQSETTSAALREQLRTLQERYNLLLPKLGQLETTLNQSETVSTALQEQLQASGEQLRALTLSLKVQTGKTVSLEKQVRRYKTAFFVSLGVGIAGVGTGVLLYLLK